ncbi:MAG: hypothetical protein R3D59_17270 [Paracoccaceae bacterium]
MHPGIHGHVPQTQDGDALLLLDIARDRALGQELAVILFGSLTARFKANDKYADLLGFEHGELDGTPLQRLFPPEAAATFGKGAPFDGLRAGCGPKGSPSCAGARTADGSGSNDSHPGDRCRWHRRSGRQFRRRDVPED